MSFAKDWTEAWDQKVDMYVQGALQVVPSDPGLDCEIVYRFEVFDE
jgi:hypothetical protein